MSRSFTNNDDSINNDNENNNTLYEDTSSITIDDTEGFHSFESDHHNESSSRVDYIIDTGDLLDDDQCNFKYDLSKPLYDTARITVKKATSELMNFAVESNSDKSTTIRLFKLVKSLLPTSNILPTTYTTIMKSLEQLSLSQSKYYCNGCTQLCIMRKNKKICDNRDCAFSRLSLKSHQISKIVELDLATQLKTIISRNFSLFFNEQKLSQDFDVPHGRQYQSFPTSKNQKITLIIHADDFDVPHGRQYQSFPTSKNQKITLIIHADGSPLVRTTKSSVWPVFGSIVELPHQVREFQSNILVLALWASCQKPNVDLLMKNCIAQLVEYEKNDLVIMVKGIELHINIQRQMFIADLPAKSLFMKTISYNGYSACTVCTAKGTCKGQVVYPYRQNMHSRRVHEEVVLSGKEAEQKQVPVDGIKGVSPMLQILNYPDQVVYDYMHLVCLGHMATLVKRWLPHLERNQLNEIDSQLKLLRLPHNVHAKFNYSIGDVSEWHAKHSRLFVLNVGLPSIISYLPKVMASHFAVYCLAIKLLHCPKSIDEISFAESLIDYYCRTAPLVFDGSIELLSLHAHMHLGEQVRQHGDLAFSSAFCFESCIRYLKKMVHGTKNLASQIAYWCDMRSAVPRPEFILQQATGKTKILFSSVKINQYRHILMNKLLEIGHDCKNIILFLRYKDKFNTYHSIIYDDSFSCASFIVSYNASTTGITKGGKARLPYSSVLPVLPDDTITILRRVLALLSVLSTYVTVY
ncbi:unnamed protein product [Rotaria magnacalcarata]|uniref:Uncharacterized protein n=7 Tax=Rotaria magnacalcarata TaxID=392030 RepID=A0A816YAL8_9BILA|nr:unnamed protein product [Rotaria magnacalcarata]